MTELSAWIGKTEERVDHIDAARARALQGALGETAMLEEGGALPPLYHWLYFWEMPRLSETGPDGHPKRGEFLPPVEAPRRMWASGAIRFLGPLCAGAEARQISTIQSIERKEGRSGALTFVTVRRQIFGNGVSLLEEDQVIVYRDADSGGAPAHSPEVRRPQWRARLMPDEVLLFRYSALTLNSHRIHYDRRYATEMEGYPGLVVHGPLQAILMAGLLARELGKPMREFSFRGLSPAFEGVALDVQGLRTPEGGDAWVEQAGRRTMSGVGRT